MRTQMLIYFHIDAETKECIISPLEQMQNCFFLENQKQILLVFLFDCDFKSSQDFIPLQHVPWFKHLKIVNRYKYRNLYFPPTLNWICMSIGFACHGCATTLVKAKTDYLDAIKLPVSKNFQMAGLVVLNQMFIRSLCLI